MDQHRNYTQGKKGQKLPRINMAFYGDNLQYVKEAAYKARQSITEYINQLIAEDRQQHCQKTPALNPREPEAQAEDYKKCYEDLLAKTQKLELDLKREKKLSQNYWRHIVWMRTPEDMKPKMAPCPICGSEHVGLEGSVCCRKFFVWCLDCDAMGPEADGEANAIRAWNKGDKVTRFDDEEDETEPEQEQAKDNNL